MAAATSAQTFSHRKHLAMKLECVMCHAAATSSSKAADNLIPKAEVCATCHTGELALKTPPTIRAPRDSNVSKFSHQIHAKFGNTIAGMVTRSIDSGAYLGDPTGVKAALATAGPRPHACTGCHRGLSVSDTTSEANFPHMADCLVCHDKIDAPFSCEKCHQPSEKLKPVSHAVNFLDKHSDKVVQKVGCQLCHGRRFTCLGCH